MKKILVLMLAVVMALSVVAFVACSNTKTVTGEYSYDTKYGKYGAKVDVTVSGGKITEVKLYTDEETGWANVTSSWSGKQTWLDGKDAFLAKFKGMTVEDVNKLVATIEGQGNATENKVEGMDRVTGATQSSARVILAIQNALSKLGK